jgi:hypothetical protein
MINLIRDPFLFALIRIDLLNFPATLDAQITLLGEFDTNEEAISERERIKAVSDDVLYLCPGKCAILSILEPLETPDSMEMFMERGGPEDELDTFDSLEVIATASVPDAVIEDKPEYVIEMGM